jgi:ankyrin repeat protein
MEATLNGHQRIVRLLVSHGADVNQANLDGDYPVLLAAELGYMNILEELVKGGGSSSSSSQNIRLEAANDQGVTPLMISAGNGHYEVVQFLLLHSCSDDHYDLDGHNALHYAAITGNARSLALLFSVNTDLQQINHRDKNGATPLFNAAAHGHFNIIRLLYYACADQKIANKDKLTPLMIAQMHGHKSIIQFLTDPINSIEREAVCKFDQVEEIPLQETTAGEEEELKQAMQNTERVVLIESSDEWEMISRGSSSSSPSSPRILGLGGEPRRVAESPTNKIQNQVDVDDALHMERNISPETVVSSQSIDETQSIIVQDDDEHEEKEDVNIDILNVDDDSEDEVSCVESNFRVQDLLIAQYQKEIDDLRMKHQQEIESLKGQLEEIYNMKTITTNLEESENIHLIRLSEEDQLEHLLDLHDNDPEVTEITFEKVSSSKKDENSASNLPDHSEIIFQRLISDIKSDPVLFEAASQAMIHEILLSDKTESSEVGKALDSYCMEDMIQKTSKNGFELNQFCDYIQNKKEPSSSASSFQATCSCPSIPSAASATVITSPPEIQLTKWENYFLITISTLLLFISLSLLVFIKVRLMNRH